ncbi:MAG TPA: sensor histidine kinase efflux regulator BaeS [Burkholderiaceae bacterium]|nr:sensor histidine kinase efflux regulator BaeS [Burkholderiaceae bacterium]
MIKLGITSKLFLAILLTCAIVAIAMATGVRYSFSQGFLGYLNQQEEQRVEMLRPSLAAAYQEHGSWAFLRDNPRQWFALIRPPGMTAPNDGSSVPGQQKPRLTPPESDLTGLNLRISLLDAERRLVIGNPAAAKGAALKSVEVNGATVGWIALLPFQQVSTGAALRFQEQQLKASWIIGGSATLLAALVALLLAQMFLAPVKRIAAATHRLAIGDYRKRVAVSSGDELGKLAEDFNQLALTLEKNERLRRAFMADVSHELRTPLSVLKGELEAMEDGIRPLSEQSVRSLQAEVATLGKLVDDLNELALSDVGALTYRKSRVEVVGLLRLTVAAFEERFAAGSIGIAVEAEAAAGKAYCHADPDRLRQLFQNILENALRYTDPGGRLVISIHRNKRSVTLEFQDTKPGVPAEILPHLFERFYRVESSRNRASGGSGLGLAISRNIVEAHLGSISAASSPLGGLRIVVSLPLNGEAA